MEWYEKALTRLGHESELKEAAARTYYAIADKLYNEKKYIECLPFLNKAIELKQDYDWAYNLRGIAFWYLKDYQRAIENYDQAISLDPEDAVAYNNRGLTYDDLKDYQRVIEDYTQALSLDPKNAVAYSNRGLTYLWLKDTQQAIADYQHSWELDPTDVNSSWMAEWAQMGKERVEIDTAEMLKTIAEVVPQHYIAHVCRGVASGLQAKLNEGLAEIEAAIPVEPEEFDAYFWKGMICAYLGRNSAAMEAIEKALEVNLPPVLLTPLYWLQQDRPDFFQECARPLLNGYDV